MSLNAPDPSTGPLTATGTAPRNVDGQAIAITVFSAVKPWSRVIGPVRWFGRQWLWLLFHWLRWKPGSLKTLGELSFIHFARWTLVTRIPYNGPPQEREKLHYTHLFFESNFNGGWEEYIDAFSHILTSGMTAFWGTSYGFPQPLPTSRFKDYIQRNEIEASHFYSAYPEATTTMVLAALELDEKLEAFRQRTAGADPDAFAAAWRELLTDVQGCL